MRLPSPFRENKVFRLAVLGLVVATTAFVGFSLEPPKASADACSGLYPPGGRNCRMGFFSNTYDAFGHDVYTNGMNTYNLTNFVNKVRGYMNCQGNSLLNSGDQHATGSAFIILTMLGQPAGGTTNKHRACQYYSQWLQLVTAYNNANLIRWNTPYNFTGNTYYQDQSDDGWVDPSAPTYSGSAMVMMFMRSDNSGPLYVIKHDCANPVGVMRPLPQLRPPTGTLDAANCSTVRGTAVDPDTPNTAVRVRVLYSNGATSETMTNPSTHAWSVPTPASIQGSLYPVTARAYAYDTTLNNGIGYLLSPASRTIGPCVVPDPACAGFTITPGNLDPNTPYSIQARVNYGSDTVASAIVDQTSNQFYVRITGPNGPAVVYNRTVSVKTNPPVSRSGATLTFSTGMLPATGNTGTYVVAWGVTGGPGAINCGGDGTVPPGPGEPENPPATFDVTDQPYFDVNGGDVSAGGGMSAGGVDCAVNANPKAGIVSWNRGAAGAYGGAGTQFAAMALNHLQDFASGQGSSLAPSGVSFANTADGQVNVGTGLFGGMFDSLPCVKDHYATMPADAKPWGSYTGAANTIGSYKLTGPRILYTATTISQGSHITLYVDGDIYISGNITFAGGGSYANLASVPSFKLIAKGNIYIAPWVTQLDGLYAAQSTTASSGDGNIYTCSLVDSTPSNPAHPYNAASLNGSLYSTCQNQLEVNGAFIANQVWLLRTAGSVTNVPAETFNFGPELWATSPYDSSVSGSNSGKYDAITSLPPIL